MQGTVIKANAKREMAIVSTSRGSYTVIELLGGSVQPGDVLEGNLDDMAGETLRNVTQMTELEVFIQSVDATLEHAAQLIE